MHASRLAVEMLAVLVTGGDPRTDNEHIYSNLNLIYTIWWSGRLFVTFLHSISLIDFLKIWIFHFFYALIIFFLNYLSRFAYNSMVIAKMRKINSFWVHSCAHSYIDLIFMEFKRYGSVSVWVSLPPMNLFLTVTSLSQSHLRDFFVLFASTYLISHAEGLIEVFSILKFECWQVFGSWLEFLRKRILDYIDYIWDKI